MLGRGKRRQLGKLRITQDVDDIIGDTGQKAGVMPHIVRVVVAQVLEPEVVGNFAGGKKDWASRFPVIMARPSKASVVIWA